VVYSRVHSTKVTIAVVRQICPRSWRGEGRDSFAEGRQLERDPSLTPPRSLPLVIDVENRRQRRSPGSSVAAGQPGSQVTDAAWGVNVSLGLSVDEDGRRAFLVWRVWVGSARCLTHETSVTA
jgi:hypothetical protein